MKKNKRILFLPKWYPNRIVPANGNFIENHALAISRYARIGVLFVRSEERTSSTVYETEVDQQHAFPVVRVYFRKPPAWLKFLIPLRYWKAQWKGYKKITELMGGHPHLTHVHVMARSGPMALYLKYFKGIPYLITEHWSGYTEKSAKYRGLLRKAFTRYLVKQAETITVVSAFLRDAMKRHHLYNNYQIIPNVADTDLFVPAPVERLDMNREVRHLIHISTLDTAVKNLPGILKVIKNISLVRQDFHLHLLGDGPERKKQEQLAGALGIMDSFVTFHGEVPPATVAGRLSTSCCLILFSNYETQSVVMIEAFCCGVPVIATAVGGIPEYLDRERGMLTEAENELSLEKGIITMLETFHLYDQQHIRHYALASFSRERIGRQFADIYESVMNK